jgi:hypothetical protein
MPPRLAVIISQASTRDLRAAQIEESLVAELMMTGGLDANLVGPLDRIEPESTDLLCLAGFTQEMALLGWLPLAEAQQAWTSLQLSGSLFEFAPQAPAVPKQGAETLHGRRIPYFQLNKDSDAVQICNALKQRLQDLQIKTVSLLPVLKVAEGKKGPSLTSLPTVPPPLSVPASPVPIAPPAAIVPIAGATNGDAYDEEMWRDLDRLVDDLDALDL